MQNEGERVESVTTLSQKENVRLDSERLDQLYVQLGEQTAEDVMCRSMEELAVRLSYTERLYRRADMEKLRKSLKSIVRISEQIGTPMLAQVAKDVIRCVDQGDATAVAATLARLLRIGEGSLIAFWQIKDISS